MALDDSAAAEAASRFCAATENPLALPVITELVKAIYAGITTNAVVDPAGDTPMTVSVSGTPTPVVGTGRVT